MQRLLKITMMMAVFFLTISLIGCGTKGDTVTKVKKEEQTTDTVKVEDSKETAGEEQKPEIESDSNEINDKANEQQANATTQNTQAETTNRPTNPANPSPAAKNSTVKTTTQPATQPTAPLTPPEASTQPPVTGTTQKPETTVTFSIVGPKDRGTILGATSVVYEEGDTIFDVLLRTAKKHNIKVDSRGSGATAYIEGIANIYEFDYGYNSGWVFKQNGVSLTRSAGTMKVKDGDRIECYYTE